MLDNKQIPTQFLHLLPKDKIDEDIYGVVYLLINLVNNKIYVGQTIKSLRYRWAYHCDSIKWSCSMPIVRAIAKYGKDCFSGFELSFGFSQFELDFLEILFIDFLKSTDPTIGYNIREGGSRGAHSILTRERMSKAQLGRACPDERRQRIAITLRNYYAGLTKEERTSRPAGWHHTEEVKLVIAESSRKDKKRYEKISNSSKEMVWITDGKTNAKLCQTSSPIGWRIGRTIKTDSASLINKNSIWITNGIENERISKSDEVTVGWRKGRVISWKIGRDEGFKNPHTLEWNAKISKSSIGKVFSEEHIKNLSLSHIGISQPKELIAKRIQSIAFSSVYRGGFYGS